jgi:dihydrofolate reductase
MAKLIYSSIASVDGYVADETGNFDWAEPDEDVHTLVNELARPIGTFLVGRRMYEVLVPWETMDTEDDPPFIQDFARIWKAADKVVYSRTLDHVGSTRTRIERRFDPEVARGMKSSADRDLSIGGPDLATHAFRAGLVDEVQLFVVPVVVGGGTRFFPGGVRFGLELLDERRFDDGTVFNRYAVAGSI